MEGPQAGKLLAALYRHIPAGYRVVLRSLPGGNETSIDPSAPKLPEPTLETGQHFIGMVPRGSGGVLDLATHIWLDRDVNSDEPDFYPTPTATVASGRVNGVHAYWRLTVPVPVDKVVRLCKLARIAYDGDPAVCEPKRIMRLPGYYNQKYNPPTVCAIASLNTSVEYNFHDLEEHLAAAVVARYWDEGNRHQLALALGATLARVEWDVERVISVVRLICELTADTQVADRVVAARETLSRKDAGTAVSAAALREAMDDEYRNFLAALGVLARDGDVLVAGARVASVHNLERDIAVHIRDRGDWAYGDGQLLRWNGTFWQGATIEQLSSDIFWSVLSRAVFIKEGMEYEYQANIKIARAIAVNLLGLLEGSPLDPPDPFILPLQNGVLELSESVRPELHEHDAKYRNRWVLPVDFDRTATAPNWRRFMHEAVPTLERNLLQEWFGYMLRAGNPSEQMLWLWGPSGTGKSTFIHGIERLLKPTVAAVRLHGMNQYSLAELAEKRVAFCTEMPSRELRTDTLKALVSSDQVEARHIYGRPFNLQFTGKILWSTNTLPDIDQSEGLWRRLVIVRFGTTPAVKDEELKAKIGEELPGLLNWALGGLQRLQSRGWSRPPSVAAQLLEYQESADEFAQFALDVLDIGTNGQADEMVTSSGDLYRAYTQWATEHGFKPKSHGPAFAQELRRLGCEWIPHSVRVGKKITRAWKNVVVREVEF